MPSSSPPHENRPRPRPRRVLLLPSSVLVATILLMPVLLFVLDALRERKRTSVLGIFQSTAEARKMDPSRVAPGALRVTYTGNLFSEAADDLLFLPMRRSHGAPVVLDHRDVLSPGDPLVILGETWSRFGVGLRFRRVLHVPSGYVGYLTEETLIGETLPDVSAERHHPPVFHFAPLSEERFLRDVRLLESEDYATDLSAGNPGGVQPLYAARRAIGVALHALYYPLGDEAKERAERALVRFFTQWAIPEAQPMGRGLRWGYQFPLRLQLGVSLPPPWYSAFANSAMALASALTFRLTQDPTYRTLATRAVEFLYPLASDGGASYQIGEDVYPAEYVYDFASLPNVRVLDGELLTTVYLYNCAQLLRDARILDLVQRYGHSLSRALSGYTNPDGTVLNARYDWVIDSPGYLAAMKAAARALGAILKDPTFTEHAARWRLANSSR